MNTVIIKMISGEELIATEKGGVYGKVRTLHMNGNGQAGLAPWIVLAPDADVNITDGIVAVLPCPIDVEKMYMKAVSSIELLG